MSRVWPQLLRASLPSATYAGMVRNAVRFGEMCAAAGVDTDTVVFADEHHVTLVPASLVAWHCATCSRPPEPLAAPVADVERSSQAAATCAATACRKASWVPE
jgi:hypothetical protein